MNRSSLPRLVAIVLAAAGLAAVPAAAHAQPLTSVAISTGVTGNYMVLDVGGGSTAAGAGVIQWLGHGGANQRWNVVSAGGGTEQIVNQKSNLCLAAGGAGQQVFQWYCNASDAQQLWRGDLNQVLGGAFLRDAPLENVGSGLRLDVSGKSQQAGAKVITWYPNTGSNQGFAYWQLG